MITIRLFRNKEHHIVRFTVSGHAGMAESSQDIVCAAVTTAAMTTVNGLTDVAGITLSPEIRSGYLDCSLPKNLSPRMRREADVLLESMVLTFMNLTMQYGAYVSLLEDGE